MRESVRARAEERSKKNIDHFMRMNEDTQSYSRGEFVVHGFEF